MIVANLRKKKKENKGMALCNIKHGLMSRLNKLFVKWINMLLLVSEGKKTENKGK